MSPKSEAVSCSECDGKYCLHLAVLLNSFFHDNYDGKWDFSCKHILMTNIPIYVVYSGFSWRIDPEPESDVGGERKLGGQRDPTGIVQVR